MRRYVSHVLLLTLIISCSKKNDVERTNFAELTIDGRKFTFDKLEAIIDTSTPGIRCYIRFEDGASNSSLLFKTITGLGRIVDSYQLPGELFPGPSLEYLHLQTYVNRVPGTYLVLNNSLTVIIDKAVNGRMHGSLSGKASCLTCTPYGAEVSITNGEFEVPYSYQ